MRKFLIKFCLFILPIIFFFGGIEWYVRNLPNAFITKSKYLKENLNSIQTLVLGTSHSQNGINPKYFSKKTANISYGSQDINTDVALLFHYAPKMPNLTTVIFEYDYHRMDIDNPPEFYRFPWYYIFYNIEVKPLSLKQKFSLYFSNPTFFNHIILDRFENKPEQKVNKYGFVEKNYTNEFLQMDYDEQKINQLAKVRLANRHKEYSNPIFQKNKKNINILVAYCKQNNIQLVFVSSPLYSSYIHEEISQKAKRNQRFIDTLKKNFHINYLDLSKSKRFTVKDFSNEDHLNAEGAKKYSKILDSLTK